MDDWLSASKQANRQAGRHGGTLYTHFIPTISGRHGGTALRRCYCCCCCCAEKEEFIHRLVPYLSLFWFSFASLVSSFFSDKQMFRPFVRLIPPTGFLVRFLSSYHYYASFRASLFVSLLLCFYSVVTNLLTCLLAYPSTFLYMGLT